ncbi:MAG: efflux RND transporter permease subunit [Brachymonas sp.]|nr:efflux RND transporter permease subunit [Brachymonas sp.]
MNFSAYSIRNPIPAILLFILLTVAGLLAFKATHVQDFPDMDFPIVTVTVAQPGAAPAQLETQVARKVEDTISTVTGIENMYSTVIDGVVITTVQFRLEKNLTDAVSEVRDAVSLIRSDLPPEIREPIISKVDITGRPVYVYALQPAAGSGWDQQQLSWFVDNTFNKRIMTIEGVGQVKRIGGVSREVQVILQPERMQALGVTAADISSMIGYTQLDAPSGRSDVGGTEQSVRTVASARSVEELAALQIPLPTGTIVRLGDVAEVHDTVADPRAAAMVNGQDAVLVEIYRSKGASELNVARDASAAIAKMQEQNPGVQITRVIDNAKDIQNNFDGSMNLLYEGAILAVVVVYFFLRDWRATIVAASALPLSIIPTFLGIYLFGYSLNGVTLLSLSLVIGVLVDDAIVEIENIARHLQMGKTPYQAAMEAADEIGVAVLATTFALVAVFLPTAFMSGIVGRVFKQFGWTAVISVLASLVVARLLTPMMSAYFLRAHKGHAIPQEDETGAPDLSRDGPVMRWYMRAMQWCVQHRLITMLAAAAMFIGSLALVPFLAKGFVPVGDRSQTQINIELPPGSTLAQTREVAEQARLALAGEEEIKTTITALGAGASGGNRMSATGTPEVRRATLTIITTPRRERSDTLVEIEDRIRHAMTAIPGARFGVGGMDSGSKMEIILLGDNAQTLAEVAREAERQLRTIPGVGGVTSSAAMVQPEIIIRPDYARASELGITAAAIARTVRVATAGDYDQLLPKLNLPERQVPIRVKLPEGARNSIEAVRSLQVAARGGSSMVPLESIASVQIESGPSLLERSNRSRSIKLSVELGGQPLGQVSEAAHALPVFKQLPPGVRQSEQGDTEQMGKLFTSFGIAMVIGIFCVYAVLVLLFKDFMQPITILGALPLSIGGAFVALLLTNKALSMPTMIGMIMLMGVVSKNSILLVDYAIMAREQGKSRLHALMDACHKRSRPVIMTSLAMGAGMLPLALGWSKGDSSFNQPMAITVIGGLITSTFLSLLVVPAAFTYVDDFEHWFKHKLGIDKVRAEAAADAQAESAAHG